MSTEKRWHVVATYRAHCGPVPVDYEIEELEELQEIIEQGPDWNALIDVKITLARVSTVGIVGLDGEMQQ
jgi:hypothetical protein